jgi:hypothetical protein
MCCITRQIDQFRVQTKLHDCQFLCETCRFHSLFSCLGKHIQRSFWSHRKRSVGHVKQAKVQEPACGIRADQLCVAFSVYHQENTVLQVFTVTYQQKLSKHNPFFQNCCQMVMRPSRWQENTACFCLSKDYC